VNVDDAYTLAVLAHYLAAVGRFDQAASRLARAKELAPENMYVHYYAALIAATGGDTDEAIDASRRAIENGYPGRFLAADSGLQSLADSEIFRELVTSDTGQKADN
jgi:tetratricopeptide (TPR) repeat protein